MPLPCKHSACRPTKRRLSRVASNSTYLSDSATHDAGGPGGVCNCWPRFWCASGSKLGRIVHAQILANPMCPFSSNAIGSHQAPLRAILLVFFRRTPSEPTFCTRSQKGTFKGFPPSGIYFSLFESSVQKLVFRALLGPSMRVLGSLCVFGRNRFHRMVQMI